MGKAAKEAKSLADAIEKLETIGTSAAQDLKTRLGSDYEQVVGTLEDTLESLKPHIDRLREAASEGAGRAKAEVETKLKDNPWVIVAGVGLVALFIGWLLGRQASRPSREDDSSGS